MNRRVAWLLVPLGWALACGGRFEETGSEGGGAESGSSTGQGGSGQSKAGTSSRAGTTGNTGKGGAGQIGMGGAPATGGAYGTSGSVAVGGGCACGPIGCGPGYINVPNANACCSHCELDLEACEANRQGYRQFRQQLIDKYASLGCSEHADCAIYYEKNGCGISSCAIAVPQQALVDLDNNLNSYAQASCAPDCPHEPQPPCVDVSPTCWMGYCR